MNFKKIFYILVIVVVFFLMFFLFSNNTLKKTSQVGQIDNIKYVKIAGQNIKVDLALTKEAQEQGLSGRSELKENEGMLFVFDKEGEYPFWMKDMNFPIDIIWIREDLRVVYIKKRALPESFPENFTPEKNAKYVLEVSADFSDKNNLKIGDSAAFMIAI